MPWCAPCCFACTAFLSISKKIPNSQHVWTNILSNSSLEQLIAFGSIVPRSSSSSSGMFQVRLLEQNLIISLAGTGKEMIVVFWNAHSVTRQWLEWAMIEEKIANPYKCQPPQNHVGEGGGGRGIYQPTHRETSFVWRPPKTVSSTEFTSSAALSQTKYPSSLRTHTCMLKNNVHVPK